MTLPSNVPANPNANAAPEPPEWDALPLHTKLQHLAWQVDSCITDGPPSWADCNRALDAVEKLETLSAELFERAKKGAML